MRHTFHNFLLVSPNPSPKPLLQSPPEPPVRIPPLKTEDILFASQNAEKLSEERKAIHQKLSRSGRNNIFIFFSKKNLLETYLSKASC